MPALSDLLALSAVRAELRCAVLRNPIDFVVVALKQ
jgi:hypothetical protein